MPRSLAQEPQPHGKVLLQHLHLCDSLCVEAVGTKPIKVSLDTVKNPPRVLPIGDMSGGDASFDHAAILNNIHISTNRNSRELNMYVCIYIHTIKYYSAI